MNAKECDLAVCEKAERALGLLGNFVGVLQDVFVNVSTLSEHMRLLPFAWSVRNASLIEREYQRQKERRRVRRRYRRR